MNEIPQRFERNIGTLGKEGQQRLHDARVAVIGAGGLGGTVCEILARAGVGFLRIVDFDDFVPSNLNRQINATIDTLGTNKALAAAERARAIDPEVVVEAYAGRFDEKNARDLLTDIDLVCDCLDSIPDRFLLERKARAAEIPMVHAAVAGLSGQVMMITPEGKGLDAVYGPKAQSPEAGLETTVGNIPSTVTMVASLQAHLAIAHLAETPLPPKNTLLRLDLSTCRLIPLEL